MSCPVRSAPRGGNALLSRAVLLALSIGLASSAGAQSTLGHSPNLRGEWTMDRWQTVFVFSHRFEFIQGGDELINFPTLSLATGLGGRLAAGLDYTSNSETVPGRLGGNETQYWASVSAMPVGPLRLSGIVGWNTAARSTDAAITAALGAGWLTILGEARGYSNVFGGDAGSAAAGGVVLHLTRYLELSADVGRLVSPDTVAAVWSAGAAVAIPGSPHTLSLHATNGGALTLQGASRPRVIGRQPVRYGFTFTVPLGSRAQWARIFRRDAPASESEGGPVAARVEMRLLAYAPREIRIRVGETVEWVNRDPLDHTVTADDGSWDSGLIADGRTFRRTFDRAGRFTYHCTPHPQMTGAVVVEEAGHGDPAGLRTGQPEPQLVFRSSHP